MSVVHLCDLCAVTRFESADGRVVVCVARPGVKMVKPVIDRKQEPKAVCPRFERRDQ